jgi:hypothetical protein
MMINGFIMDFDFSFKIFDRNVDVSCSFTLGDCVSWKN